jgi:galactose oxidase
MDPKDVGKWDNAFDLLNVCIHASLLPTGKILYWGRRKEPKKAKDEDLNSMHEHETASFILDLNATGNPSKPTANAPKDQSGNNVNLFCSGHTFQPDGKLLVVGGHLEDGTGSTQACIFDPDGEGKWIPKESMGRGRWYPTAIKLPDGNILVVSGSVNNVPEPNPQLWRGEKWEMVASTNSVILYPRLFIDPNGSRGTGSVFMSSPTAESQWLLPPDFGPKATVGVWEPLKVLRQGGQREYAPSVMYNSGKVILIGGGADNDQKPESTCKVIDLTTKEPPQWKDARSMGHARRQHNATILPDGTLLVTGGSSGAGFNNVNEPVRTPELWNPKIYEFNANQTDPKTRIEEWKKMAPEQSNRCYHSIALLLPTGQVLSAGGGEWIPDFPVPKKCNKQEDTLTNAQIFNPPYLFDAQNKPAIRPSVSNFPTSVDYDKTFTVTVGANDDIARVTWIHIGSVTHCNNQSQSFLELPFNKKKFPKIEITLPSGSNLAPPGHYMLFVLNKNNVPAIAPIIRLNPGPTPVPNKQILARHIAVEDHVPLDHKAVSKQMIADQKRPAVVIGLTPLCPYGLGPCWGGAHEALQHISDVDLVRPLPNKEDSLAFVYTEHDILPDPDVWRSEFQKLAGGAYTWRGIEMSLSGVVTSTGTKLTLAGNDTRPELVLARFKQSSKIEWDLNTSSLKSMSDDEAGAYAHLAAAVAQHPGMPVKVTGTLQKLGDGEFSLDVKGFEVIGT